MEFSLHLWFEYILRFSHLVAGISWIGSSFYFIWLDSSFTPPEVPRRNVEGELFMVHGGFYYQVEKRKIYPGELPKVLHWFKWEATLTWFTGLLLFMYLYFLRGASLLIDAQVMGVTQLQAIGMSLAIMIGTWFIYDLIWNAKIIKLKSISTILSALFFCGLIIFLTKIFSGRGAFVLTGVIFGSLMLANVWIRILPGQAKMLKEARSGQIPDYSVSLKSKTRSVHNTYFTFPVLFIMLSNHYPTIYNHSMNWLLLILLAISGALTRHAMVTRKPKERWALFFAAIGLGALVYLTTAPASFANIGGPRVEFTQVQGVFQNRCATCHSQNPTDDIFKTAPLGAVFESETQIRAKADKIYLQVVAGKTMPLGNKTGMTDAERLIIDQWLRQQGLVQGH